jgi:hypothetical protein
MNNVSDPFSDLEYGEGLHGGVNASLDINGNLEANPKVGFGEGFLGSVGKFKGVDVSTSPEIDIDVQRHPDDSFVGDR